MATPGLGGWDGDVLACRAFKVRSKPLSAL
jgi:hypothetical protein